MADISKITLLDGTTYNFKDAEARNSIPDAATELPEMNGTAAVGTSEKYAKEDHVHPSDDNKLDNFISTESGNIVTFHDGADGLPLKSLVASIVPVQDLHGQDAPYPPGGGKNKLNNTATTTTSNGVTFTVNADGTVTASGTATGTAVLRIYQTFDITEDIILNGCPSGGQITVGYSMIAANSSGTTVGSAVDTGSGVTIPAANIPSIAQIQIIVRNGTTVNNLVFKPMIRLASVADGTYTTYSNICPISGWTGVNVWNEPIYDTTAQPKLQISWQDTAGTVYGGTMTVNEDGSGDLASARAKKIFDGTEALSYTRNSETSGYAIYRLGAKNAVAVYASGLSNMLKPVISGLAKADWSQAIQNSTAFNQDQIAFRFSSDFDGGTPSGTVTNYKAELARLYAAETPLEVCYELATPQTYHFDNLEQLTTLLGTNNIWVNTGDVSVTYYNQNLDSLILNNIKALNGHTVNADVPANAIFTDTTYESKTAASGGTDVSLVTTGEKATWNGKVNISQGTSNAGKFLVVGSDGNVTTITMSAWQGGSY